MEPRRDKITLGRGPVCPYLAGHTMVNVVFQYINPQLPQGIRLNINLK